MTELEEIVKDLQSADKSYKLIVFNDSVNTFDHVISCFIRILGHTPVQAEQCAQIIHNTGKYAVKLGSFEELEPYCNQLTEQRIDAVVTI